MDVQNYHSNFAGWSIANRGCQDQGITSATPAAFACRDALTDDRFFYGGSEYRVMGVHHAHWQRSGRADRNNVYFESDRELPDAIKERGILVVGSTSLRLADGHYADVSSGEHPANIWTSSTLNLSTSGRVQVRLEMPAPRVPSVDGGAGRNTVWSSTLTVSQDGIYFGCETGATQERCSSALTDDEFEYNGVTYQVRQLSHISSTNRFLMAITPTPRANLAGMVLHLGPTRLTLGDFGVEERSTWNNVDPQWSDGRQVGVRLTAPDPSPALSASGPTVSASGDPREGGGPVTVTVTLPEPALDGGVNVTVNLGGTATWGVDYRTPIPAGPEFDDYRRSVHRDGYLWFSGTSSESVQAANLLRIPSGSRSASFEIDVVDDAHEDSGESIDVTVRADHAGIQYTGSQESFFCPTCSRRTSLLTYMGYGELTLRIANHEDAQTEAARLAAEAAAEAEQQRLAAARAAAGGPLSGLALTAGSQPVALVPAFSPNVTSYRAQVPAGTAGVRLAPSWGALAELRGSPTVLLLSLGEAAILTQTRVHDSGAAAELALSSAGPTRLEVTVVEPDGSGKWWQGTATRYRVEIVGAAVPQPEPEPVTVPDDNTPQPQPQQPQPQPQQQTPEQQQPQPQQQQTADPAETPGAVVGLQLTAKGDKVIVAWEAPASGGAPDRYIAHIKNTDTGKGKNRKIAAGKTTTTFGNLTPGATYRVWVRAQNDAGKGERIHARVTLPDGAVRGGEGDPPPQQQSEERETGPPVPGQTEPYNVQVTPGDGTLTVTWTVSPRPGEADDDIHHALRWSQTPGVWANPAGPRGHHNDGIVIWGGTATYTITGLTNGIATGVFVRSFTGTRTGEDSPHTSKWIRIKGENTTPRAAE